MQTYFHWTKIVLFDNLGIHLVEKLFLVLTIDELEEIVGASEHIAVGRIMQCLETHDTQLDFILTYHCC